MRLSSATWLQCVFGFSGFNWLSGLRHTHATNDRTVGFEHLLRFECTDMNFGLRLGFLALLCRAGVANQQRLATLQAESLVRKLSHGLFAYDQ